HYFRTISVFGSMNSIKHIVLYFALFAFTFSEITVHHIWAVVSPTEARGESPVQPQAAFMELSQRLYHKLSLKRDFPNSGHHSFLSFSKFFQKKPSKSVKMSPKIFLLHRALLI
ncbi:MAG: hypothetical protein RIA69_12675, partial [Cyclobacteriaceae bacterium]